MLDQNKIFSSQFHLIFKATEKEIERESTGKGALSKMANA